MCENNSLIRQLEILNDLYDKLNERLFESALSKNAPKPLITIKEKKNTYGHISVCPVWVEGVEAETVKRRELNINPEYLNRDKYAISCTLVHEMCHENNLEHDIQDCSRSGGYHNIKFKAEAEKRLLKVTKAQKVGYGVTDPTEEFKKLIDTLQVDFVGLKRMQELSIGKSKSSSTRKLVCPDCGLTVRATKDGLKILCVDCDCLLEYED